MGESKEDILCGDIFDKLVDDNLHPKKGFMKWLLNRVDIYRASIGQVSGK